MRYIHKSRLIAYDAAKQIAELANPDDDRERIRMDTALLVQVKPNSADGIVALIGEVTVNDGLGLCFKPRVYSQTASGMNFELFKRMVLKRRELLNAQGFS